MRTPTSFILKSGDFDLRGYEVVRTQFLVSASITSVSFSRSGIRFSNGCIRKFNGNEYIELLVHPQRQLIIVRLNSKMMEDTLVIQQTFSLNGDEIVRGEYFSHAKEPMLTFNPVRNLIYVNAVCLKRLPDMDYALIIISSSEKRLSIYPCGTNELNAVCLRSGGVNRNKPRHIRCHADFSDKMLSLMQWSRECQYKILGYIATGNNNSIIVFDLSSAEVFAPRGGSTDTPAQLHKGFGGVFDEQRSNPLIRIISQDTAITWEEMEEKQDDC